MNIGYRSIWDLLFKQVIGAVFPHFITWFHDCTSAHKRPVLNEVQSHNHTYTLWVRWEGEKNNSLSSEQNQSFTESHMYQEVPDRCLQTRAAILFLWRCLVINKLLQVFKSRTASRRTASSVYWHTTPYKHLSGHQVMGLVSRAEEKRRKKPYWFTCPQVF